MMLILSVFRPSMWAHGFAARFTGTDDHQSSCSVLKQTLIPPLVDAVLSGWGFVMHAG